MELLSLARSLTVSSQSSGIHPALRWALLGGLLPAALMPLPSLALVPPGKPSGDRVEGPSPQELQLERGIPEGEAVPEESPALEESTDVPKTGTGEQTDAKDPQTNPENKPNKRPNRKTNRDLQANPQSNPQTNPEQKPSSDQKSENRVYLAERQISFVPPPNFTVMSNEEINLKFPGSMPPQYAYGNDRRNVSIGISFSDIDLAPEQLAEVRQFLESYLEEAVPGFEWVARDYEMIAGTRWIKLEFISQALDTKVHNDLYITSFKGKLLGFNFNSVVAMEKKLRAQLNASRSSILLEPLATAQGVSDRR
ncbi:MAG: hypothetical protein HC857_18075 [Synechococcales cyanobacterium RU_4_20]|nr:hypothetical protein [Synechococcales cyanobacterium RU_4_20]